MSNSNVKDSQDLGDWAITFFFFNYTKLVAGVHSFQKNGKTFQ